MLAPKDLFKYEKSMKTYEELAKTAKTDLQKNMWKWFVALTEIPRGSGNTKGVADWLVETGKKIGCEVQKDKTGNVLLRKAGTKGLEELDGIVLQSHMDMVCTKEADFDFDFLKQPIDVLIEGEWVTANKTTLGADDGSGLAVSLALLEMDFPHPPLEALVTTDEEIGLIGACDLVDGELLKKNSKYLVNIDSEDWGEIAMSCAGGAMRLVNLPMIKAKIPEGYVEIEMKIKKLYGGHTGIDIQLGRGNAIKWAMRMLLDNKVTKTGTPIRLISFEGGNAHNAIPSHANVTFCTPKEKADEMIAAMKHLGDVLKGKHDFIEKSPEIEFVKKELTATEALTDVNTLSILHAIEAIHHGVFKWSNDVDNLVETSQSLSVAKMVDNEMVIEVFIRTNSTDEMMEACHKMLEGIATIHGGKVVRKGTDFSGWPAEPNSHLLTTAKNVYHEMFKKDAKLAYFHAGLECGIIINKFPENQMQAISIGPTVKNPHTTSEMMIIQTANDLCDFTQEIIVHLSKK
eukprot:Anaeramoba_ignava/a607823_4602.p1 GENE.a607823_4602~~a607823_4602.p1  ORF type:complete len:516 (-),score=163.22 a607823_4602:207-1754(-)